ncbi:MAG: isoprenylcysteine carboxylmethyltransferase family protein [Cyanobacteria bacterium]|nr:isoprenylcysteine carboxylmethyltransferase family protein [Cyanobacteriota bacterium]
MNPETFWAAAAISIAIVSWFFYRFVVPKSWKEWARAGVVQAFIIAFYAEMYGFPITLYFLTRWFGLDVSGPFWDQNLWIYLTGTQAAMLISMTIGYAIAFFGVALISSGWREVYRARKENRMATDGPYAVVRHPQYTGIFLVVFGEGVVHWPTIFSLAAFPLIVLAYVGLARKEERHMIERFGEEYIDYRQRIPMFFPRWDKWRDLFQPSVTHPRDESNRHETVAARRH